MVEKTRIDEFRMQHLIRFDSVWIHMHAMYDAGSTMISSITLQKNSNMKLKIDQIFQRAIYMRSNTFPNMNVYCK